MTGKNNLSRRRFLSRAAGAVVLPYFVPASVFAGARSAPSERITLGFIGAGKQSKHLMRSFLNSPGTKVVAACDVDKLKLARGKKIVSLHRDQKAGGYRVDLVSHARHARPGGGAARAQARRGRGTRLPDVVRPASLRDCRVEHDPGGEEDVAPGECAGRDRRAERGRACHLGCGSTTRHDGALGHSWTGAGPSGRAGPPHREAAQQVRLEHLAIVAERGAAGKGRAGEGRGGQG